MLSWVLSYVPHLFLNVRRVYYFHSTKHAQKLVVVWQFQFIYQFLTALGYPRPPLGRKTVSNVLEHCRL